MANSIPFIHTTSDCEIAKRIYSDSLIVRINLKAISALAEDLPRRSSIWLDPAVDALHNLTSIQAATDNSVAKQWLDYIERFDNATTIVKAEFLKKPIEKAVKEFVYSVLDECLIYEPTWLSVPQLPIVSGTTRNKLNTQLARSTAAWRVDRSFRGKLILPIIITKQDQSNKKTQRNPHVAQVARGFKQSSADGTWTVDASLADQEGSGTFASLRFPGIVDFQSEIGERIPESNISVVGPYWGMNLVLWARNLATHPAIGLGSSYQYHIPGLPLYSSKTRIAIAPLRRWAIASPELKRWLLQALLKTPKNTTEFDTLKRLFDNFPGLLDGSTSKMQISRFYRDWLDILASVPSAGKALALYQDLSSAYVYGKSLPDLPRGERRARVPWRIAKQYMLNVL